MSVVQSAVSDMLITVKSREVQRAMLAEARKDRSAAARHFLAAAHLELVLADDYAAAGEQELAFRAQRSAASCLWRAGREKEARQLFETIVEKNPQRRNYVDGMIAELEEMK